MKGIKVFSLLLALGTNLMFAGCQITGSNDPGSGDGINVTGLTLNSTSTVIHVDETFQLVPAISPSDATDKRVTWASDNPGVATVNASGLVTGVSSGAAAVTATTGDVNFTATCSVTVTANSKSSNADAGAIILSSGTLTPGFAAGITEYTVTVDNALTFVTVTAIPSDPGAVASAAVTLTGLVPGIAQTASLTITAEDGITTRVYSVAVTRESSTPALPPIAIGSSGKVYIAGVTGYLGSNYTACYWEGEDGTRRDIADAKANSYANAMLYTNMGCYIIGRKVDENNKERAVFWFNGKEEYLDDSAAFARAITLNNGTVYVAGYRNSDANPRIPCYWEIRDTWTMLGAVIVVTTRTITLHDLPTDGYDGTASGIAAGDDGIYVCGGYNGKACYWLNRTRVDLADGKYAYAIGYYDGKLYTGGQATGGRACYWTGTVQTLITGIPTGSPAAANGSYVVSIDVGSNGIFMGGSYWTSTTNGGFLWKDGTLTTKVGTSVSSVAQLGTDLYALTDTAIWKNGIFTQLPFIADYKIIAYWMGIY